MNGASDPREDANRCKCRLGYLVIVFLSNIFAVFYMSGKKSGKAKQRQLEASERLSGCGSSQKSARPEAPVLPPIKPERIIVTRQCDVPLVILPDGLLMQFTDYSGVTAGTVLKRVEPLIQLASPGRRLSAAWFP